MATDSAVDQADRALNAAAQALQSTRSKSSKGEQSDTAGQILAAANVVVNILGGLASLHPATDALFGIFKGVIRLETARQDNRLEIAAVMFSMTATMHQLHAAEPIFASDDSDLKEPLTAMVNKLSSIIEGFGNFTSMYYKSKAKVFHLLRADDNKSQLSSYKQDFLQTKEEMKTYLQICHVKLSLTIADNVDSANGKLDEILSLMNTSKDRDQDPAFWNYVDAHGGKNAVINDDKFLQDAAGLLDERLTGPIVAEIRTEMSDLLQNNQAQFEATLSETVGTAVIDGLRMLATQMNESDKEQRFTCVQCTKEYRNSINGPASCSFHRAPSYNGRYSCCAGDTTCEFNSHRARHHCEYAYSSFFEFARKILNYTNTVEQWVEVEDTNLESDTTVRSIVGQLIRWDPNTSRLDRPILLIKCGKVSWDESYFMDTFTPEQLAVVSHSVCRTKDTIIFRSPSNSPDLLMAEWLTASNRITGIRITAQSATSYRPYVRICPLDIATCTLASPVISMSEGGFWSFTPASSYSIPETVRLGPELRSTPLRDERADFLTKTSAALPVILKPSSPPLKANVNRSSASVDNMEGSVSVFNKAPSGSIAIDSIRAEYRLVGDATYQPVPEVQVALSTGGNLAFPFSVDSRQTVQIQFTALVPKTPEDKKLDLRWFNRALVARHRPLRLKIIIKDIEGAEASLVYDHVYKPLRLETPQPDDLAFFYVDNPEQFTRGYIHVTPSTDETVAIRVNGIDVAVKRFQQAVYKALQDGVTEIDLKLSRMGSFDTWGWTAYALVDLSCRRVYALKLVLTTSNLTAGTIGYVLCPKYGNELEETRPISYANEVAGLPDLNLPKEVLVVSDDQVDDFVPEPPKPLPAIPQAPSLGEGGGSHADIVQRLDTLDLSINRLTAVLENLVSVLEKKL